MPSIIIIIIIGEFDSVPPSFGVDRTEIEAIFNSTINLTCTTYGHPKPTVSFLIGTIHRKRCFLDRLVERRPPFAVGQLLLAGGLVVGGKRWTDDLHVSRLE